MPEAATAPVLKKKPTQYRGAVARGLAAGDGEADGGRVDRAGGRYSAGLIRGAAIITRGEALGHGAWIDADMLAQVADALNAAPNGIKSRFTHPSLSGDGLGKFLGRAFDARVEGDRVLADVHLSPRSHDTPEGDLGEYVLAMADDEADAFGVSIVFNHDAEAEEKFMLDNGAEWVETYFGMELRGFESPDELNVNNYPHARLAVLSAADVVDDPAANPDGMFHRGGGDGVAFAADAVLAYALGLTTDTPPNSDALGIDPDRLRGFVGRFMAHHSITLQKEATVPEDSKPTDDPKPADDVKPQDAAEDEQPTGEPAGDTPPADTAAGGEPAGDEPAGDDAPAPTDLAAASAPYREEFGEQLGSMYFSQGLDIAEARKKENKRLKDENAALRSSQSDDDGVPFSATGVGTKKKGRKLHEYATSKSAK